MSICNPNRSKFRATKTIKYLSKMTGVSTDEILAIFNALYDLIKLGCKHKVEIEIPAIGCFGFMDYAERDYSNFLTAVGKKALHTGWQPACRKPTFRFTIRFRSAIKEFTKEPMSEKSKQFLIEQGKDPEAIENAKHPESWYSGAEEKKEIEKQKQKESELLDK